MEKDERNNTINCFILDDEIHAIDRLEILIEKVCPLQIAGRETQPEKAIETILKIQPEIVFLDIVMAGMTGFEVIESLREKGFNPTFIFVTAHENYSIHAIKKAAFDYLLKPVDINELKETIRRYETVRPVKKHHSNGNTISFDCLSDREKEIARHLVEGKTSRKIAEILYLSKNTVDTHRRNILDKTRLKYTNELIRYYLSSKQ
jgi:DNA-binding NarL/FixJ family response regulator